MSKSSAEQIYTRNSYIKFYQDLDKSQNGKFLQISSTIVPRKLYEKIHVFMELWAASNPGRQSRSIKYLVKSSSAVTRVSRGLFLYTTSFDLCLGFSKAFFKFDNLVCSLS